mmetsp:Transcript_6015/g.8850  ORF Transcript_6015/g.8850 Transcript_6015/m.8850 type:complete len:109 (-) Transcript_6015:15-341(-)
MVVYFPAVAPPEARAGSGSAIKAAAVVKPTRAAEDATKSRRAMVSDLALSIDCEFFLTVLTYGVRLKPLLKVSAERKKVSFSILQLEMKDFYAGIVEVISSVPNKKYY